MNPLRNIKTYTPCAGQAYRELKLDGGTGERTYARSLDEVAEDARARYCLVAESCARKPQRILDAGCGVGYGSWILAHQGHSVIGVDNCQKAIEIARESWTIPDKYLLFQIANLEELNENFKSQDVIVAFEVLEHLAFPERFLQWARKKTDYLFVSVPNEIENPYNSVDYPFHFKHYTPAELYSILDENGFSIHKYVCQREKKSMEVHEGTNGRTLIAMCKADK